MRRFGVDKRDRVELVVESGNQTVWTACYESGSLAETRIGQTLSRADEYYRCEYKNTIEEYQKQNNNLW
jgi:hypothetical protein